MSLLAPDATTVGAGAIVGLVLGLLGGGGSILAVPLMVYGVGVASPHVAIGTSAIAVSVSAFANLIAHWRAGNVRWASAGVFALAGVAGAVVGSSAAKAVDGKRLLALFGVLMIGVGLAMFRRPRLAEDREVRLSAATARRLLPSLVGIGLGVGLLSGFFGIGGGFLIVPGLIAATGMPIALAIGTSLVSVTAFGAATGASYAVSGLVDWRLALLFIGGGVAGGFAGVALGKVFARRKSALRFIFGGVVVMAGLYVSLRGLSALIGR